MKRRAAVSLLGGALWVLVGADPSHGQCPPPLEVTVTPNPEPGSTPPSWVQGSQLDATNGAWFFVPWGGLTFTFQPSAGDWQFRFAGGGGYYGTPLFGGVHCENQQVNGVTCTVCSGSGGSMTLYAQYGGIEGDVFNAASRVKVDGGGLSVGVTLLEGGGSVFGQSPDENGHFAFRGGGEFYQNGWGLPVYCETPGECGSRPTALYKVWLYPDEYVPAGVASSEVTYVELEYKPPYHEPPCDPCDPSCTDPRAGSSKSCPPCPPKSVGKPVDVLSGNMYFDQTDAAVAGIGPSLALTRTYNSQNVAAGRYGLFGPGWFSTFERRITFPEPVVAMLRQGTGRVLYFQDVDGDGTFVPSAPATERSQIVRQADGSYLRPFPAGGSESYDSAGRLVALTDTAGNSLAITRDASGLMTAVTEPGGRAVRFDYLTGAYGTRVKSVSGPQGPIAIYEYDNTATGYLQSVSYPEGGGYSFVYDASGRLTQVSDSTGRIVETHAYDSQGRATTSEVADGREKYTLAYAANQTTVTDALGNATVYEWEPIRGLRRVTKVSGPCQSCGGGGGSEFQEWTYDDLGRIVSATDSSGIVTTYTYDSAGNIVSETVTSSDGASSLTTTYTYDAQGRVLTRTAPDGAVTTYTYGPAGPLTITESVTSTETRTTSMAYDAQGRPTSITDPRGKTTTMAYNTSGDLVSVTDPLSHTTEFGYDAMGRRTTVTDPLDNTTTTTYDGQGRVTRVTSPDDTHTDFTYDAAGRRTGVTDPMGRTTGYIYDAYGRLDKVVDPAGGVTSYGYDLMSRLTSLTDAKGRTTLFEYDAHGRMTKMTYPGGAFETFAYDAAGRLTTKTDRKGIVTTYSYDGFGRLTGKTYSDGTPPVTYTYHPQSGRLLTAANGTDTLSWTYDLAGQLLTEQSSRNASTVAYTYDAGGNRLTLSLDGQLFVSYAYDDASRLTSITRGTNVFSFGYDPASRRTSMSYPNGVVTSYTYDMLSRLTRLKADKGATPITDFQYTYDPSGNRTGKQQLDYTEDYGYDELYRLTTVSRNNGANYWAYSYDAVGNRLTSQADQTVTSSVYNEKNQLLTSAGGGPLRVRGQLDEPGTALVNGTPARMLAGNVFEAEVPASPGTNTISVTATDLTGNVTTKGWTVNVPSESATYAYDANGNLTSKTDSTGAWTYEWNAENQLTRVTKDGSEVARFAYDPLGRRVEKAGGGLTTTWAYDIDNVLHEFTGAGITLKYVNGDDTDEPLARVDGSGNVDYHHADALGSITEMTDPAGNITFMRQYDAWGKLEQGIAVAGYAFTGREWDFETGLYYYRARYYDPRLGRFASEDPLSLREGPSAYVYVDNAPVGLRDPYGLQATPPKPPRKPTPKPTPTPTPTPPSRPKNPPGSAGSTLPAVFNLCWPDGIVSYELGPNPYKDYGSWVKWKNDFIQACDDAQPPGKNYYSSCPGNPIVNPHHPGSNGICCCCEYKQRSCNNPKSEDPS